MLAELVESMLDDMFLLLVEGEMVYGCFLAQLLGS